MSTQEQLNEQDRIVGKLLRQRKDHAEVLLRIEERLSNASREVDTTRNMLYKLKDDMRDFECFKPQAPDAATPRSA
jgi:hypothetical protein